MSKKVRITELALRDAHQSLLATRLRLEDMLPIASKLDSAGFWSLEAWGGATFDSCIRYLGEDPWVRARELKQAMPNTPLQMLIRGQNILGYRHYADDVVQKFVERAVANGIEIFRIFDAMNDPRNLITAIEAVKANGQHAQGTISYTTSPIHNIDTWVELAQQIADMGVHSLAIKDMSGLLTPFTAYELVSRLKQAIDVPIHLHSHATTGMSTATLVKAVEAGASHIDTAISSLSHTYGHSATESLVTILQDTEYDTGLDINLLEEIAAYFREVRKKYAKFEGSLRGIDSRILVAQLPGGMLTNMESQLKEQGAIDKLDEVIQKIPQVRKDLGYIPLVTPTSQIVGTQTIFNVMTGEDYKTITTETAAILKGEYGATPAPVNSTLQQRVLKGEQPISCRPADNLPNEIDSLTETVSKLAKERNLDLGDNLIDAVLTYALFPQVAVKFFANRNNPDAFEAKPSSDDATQSVTTPQVNKDVDTKPQTYTVKVNQQSYVVEVSEGAEPKISHPQITAPDNAVTDNPALPVTEITAGLAGSVVKIFVKPGDKVQQSDVLLVLEAMKMETEVRATTEGVVQQLMVSSGDTVQHGQTLVTII